MRLGGCQAAPTHHVAAMEELNPGDVVNGLIFVAEGEEHDLQHEISLYPGPLKLAVEWFDALDQGAPIEELDMPDNVWEYLESLGYEFTAEEYEDEAGAPVVLFELWVDRAAADAALLALTSDLERIRALSLALVPEDLQAEAEKLTDPASILALIPREE